MRHWLIAIYIGVLTSGVPAIADERRSAAATLTFMIPADSPPSFDGHRENTFATIHAVAPFYSVLIRANPDNPARHDRLRLRSSAPRSRSRRTTARPTRS